MTPPEGLRRLTRRLSLGEAALGAGLLALGACVLVLSPPGSVALFSTDGEPLAPHVAAAFDRVRLLLGVLGLLLVALGCRRPRALRAATPVRVGDVLVWIVAGALGVAAVDAGLRWRGSRNWGSAFRTPLSPAAMQVGQRPAPRPGVFVQLARSDFDPAYRRVVFFTMNRYGLRGLLPAVPKPPGRLRIVCLGGSTTFGMSVTDGEDWPAHLGRLLGEGVEVVNAGRPGATTFRNYSFLRDRLLPLEPDVVILYEGFNDMWRGVRRHAGEQPDYGVVDEGLPAAGGTLDQGEQARWPWRVSFLTYQVGQKLDDWLEPSRDDRPEPKAGPAPFVFDPAIVAIYEQNLSALVRLCRDHGVTPVIATFAGCDDPSRPLEEQRQRLGYVLREMPALDVEGANRGLALYRAVTREVARAEGVPLLDLATLMTRDLAFFTDTVHFTPQGERGLAGLIAVGLRERGLVAEEVALP